MSTKDDGIYVPRRLVFIMIFVSLCVNVFFLLMGILIGKDDFKWQQNSQDPVAQQTPASEPEPEQGFDQELSMFNEKAEQKRIKPLDDSYLSSKKKEPQPQVNPPTRRDPEPKPEPDKTQEVSDPVVKKPEVRSTSGRFWIQVLAISDKSKALAMASKFKARGYQVQVVHEGGFHKVRVGPYEQRAAADHAKTVINRDFKIKSWVVKK